MRKWSVEGTDKSTGLKVQRWISAPTADEAATQARQDGMNVFLVRSLPADPGEDAEEDPKSSGDYGSILREIADNTKTTRSWVTFIGIIVLLWLVVTVLRVIGLIA